MGVRFDRKKEPEQYEGARMEPSPHTMVSLPLGLLPQVEALLLRRYQRFDIAAVTVSAPAAIPCHKLTLRPFQETLKKTIIGNRVSLIRSPPGSGKTTVALSVIAALGQRALVIVPRIGLLEQWVERVERELGIPKQWIGIIQGAKRTEGVVTIASQSTLVNCVQDYRGHFGVVIGDEAQTFAARTFIEVIDALHSNYRVGLTADERRSDGKDFLVRWMFGPVRAEVSRAQLEDETLLEDVRVIVVPYRREAPAWWSSLERPETRAKPAFQRAIMDYIVGDETRVELALSLMAKEVALGTQTLALSHRVQHCQDMQFALAKRGIGAGMLLGGVKNKHEYNSTRDAIKDRRIQAAIGTYQAVGVGVDLPALSAGICTTPCANFVKGKYQWNQFRGRFARTAAGKIDARIYYIWDTELFGETPLKNLAKWNRNVTVQVGDNEYPVVDFIRNPR
jgi:superfamily II DNA or RNA helicase